MQRPQLRSSLGWVAVIELVAAPLFFGWVLFSAGASMGGEPQNDGSGNLQLGLATGLFSIGALALVGRLLIKKDA